MAKFAIICKFGVTGAKLLWDWLMQTRWGRPANLLRIHLGTSLCIRVIFVYDLCKEIGQARQAATFVSEAMLISPISLFISKCVISLPLTNLSMVFQTTEVRQMGLQFPGSCLLPFL